MHNKNADLAQDWSTYWNIPLDLNFQAECPVRKSQFKAQEQYLHIGSKRIIYING